MIHPHLQKNLADLVGRPHARQALIAASLAAVIGAATALSFGRQSISTPDMTYAIKRLGEILANCRDVDLRDIRIDTERRIGKPWRQFSAAEQMAAIDYLIDQIEDSRCP